MWSLLLILPLATLALAGSSWLASFFRKDGPVPFAEIFPASMFSLFMVGLFGVLIAFLSGSEDAFLLGTTGAGWILVVVAFRQTLEISWAESLLMTSVGWLATLAAGLLWLNPRLM